MTKKWRFYGLIIAILVLGVILLFISQSRQDSEPSSALIGEWVLSGGFLQREVESDLVLQINEMVLAAGSENTYLGTGCMQTSVAGGWAPLSLQAVFDPATNTYALNILSTLVGIQGGPDAAVIRFVGESTKGAASGISYSAEVESAWTGEQSDRKVAECPAWSKLLSFQGEVGNHRDLAYSPSLNSTNFHSETQVVSTQLQVQTPDEQVILVSYYTDIFTPHINFIDSFRYQEGFKGAPVVNQPYHFTPLDILGQPIPGFESFDRYIHCDHGAATNLRGEFNPDNHFVLSWDEPQLIPGRFDPMNGHGFYQVTLDPYPWQEEGSRYGAEVHLNTHNIPWTPFEPGSAGTPDGQNYGISLSEFEDGTYIFHLDTYNYYEPADGENGHDCHVTDSRQALILMKQGGEITFQTAGAISGFLLDADGTAQGGIAVEIRGARTGFYEKVCSKENGFYLFTPLPLDTYSLGAGGFGAEDCASNSFETLVHPDVDLTAEDPIREIDLTLN